MSRTLADRAAIVGIGQTEFSKASGRSELRLACECVKGALDDAGLQARDVDGLVTFSMDPTDETEVARNLGIPMLSLFTRVPYGGGAACGVVMQAAMAIATGGADVVVCYRAFNERSGMRFEDRAAVRRKGSRPPRARATIRRSVGRRGFGGGHIQSPPSRGGSGKSVATCWRC